MQQAPQFDYIEKAELRILMISEMDALMETVNQAKKALLSNDLYEDTNLGAPDAEHYHKALSFYWHLYEPEWCGFDAEHFWQLDTSHRDMIWERLEQVLSTTSSVYKKIQTYLDKGAAKGAPLP